MQILQFLLRSFWIIIFTLNLYGQNPDWQTYYEQSGFKESASYAETIAYCEKLAHGSPWIHFTRFGKSAQQRDLPLLIINKNKHFTAAEVRSTSQVVFMIQAGIHAGEIDGKDAGFLLLRDMFIDGIDSNLCDNVTILFIPIFNVDGHERSGPYNRINQNGPQNMGWRTTAQNYNLNRDYLKTDSPEMQAWLKLYNDWLPDFFADCHVTNGADYQYSVTYFIDHQQSQLPLLNDWINNFYLPHIHNRMEEAGYPLIEYVDFRKWEDPRSGLKSAISKPRFSTGYTTIQNRPGLLIETHMLKPYKERVDGTYQILKQTLGLLNDDHLSLLEKVQTADSIVQSESYRADPYTLTYTLSNDCTFVNFLGYKFTVQESDLSGGDWYKYSGDTTTYNLPFFNKFIADKSAALPHAYIIPVEWGDIIKKMEWHGIDYSVLKKAQKMKIKTYRFSNAKWTEKPYENHHTLSCDIQEIEEEREYPTGSFVIPMNQRRARVIAQILEPQAPDSYVHWGFFDPVFERKEYAEKYVMEEYARFMLAGNDKLRAEFEQKKKEDIKFANDPLLILDWFYQQSPFWDNKIYIYPVGKIFNKDSLKLLIN
jgi:hypothetical protein